ncbi:MAG: hypothetical protein RR394_05825 [Oscillospiraceae bacterium]
MSKKAKTEPYAIAFIDFLGVKEMVANDSDGNLLVVFRTACKAALHMCKEILNDDAVTIKMFSDNVILCKRVYKQESRTNDVQGALRRVMVAASMFQYFILDTMGALVRGGITVGELYIDNMMVWGQALVDAYRIEGEIAQFPRIVIDPQLANGEFGKEISESAAVACDTDGLYYLNYINLVWKFHKLKSYNEALDKFFASNLAEAEKHSDISAVMKKLMWQEGYLDRMKQHWITEISERGDAEASDTPQNVTAPPL